MIHPPSEFWPMADADGSAEREDWPREKLLVYLSQTQILGIAFAKSRVLVRLVDGTRRNTSKTIPSPSSATAHKDMGKA